MSSDLQGLMIWPQFHLALTSFFCSPPFLLGPQPHCPPCGSLNMLSTLMPHSFCTCWSLCLWHSFPDAHMPKNPTSYLFQDFDQMSNILERPIWLPQLKLKHLHNTITLLLSFLNYFDFWYLSPFDILHVFPYSFYFSPLAWSKNIWYPFHKIAVQIMESTNLIPSWVFSSANETFSVEQMWQSHHHTFLCRGNCPCTVFIRTWGFLQLKSSHVYRLDQWIPTFSGHVPPKHL